MACSPTEFAFFLAILWCTNLLVTTVSLPVSSQTNVSVHNLISKRATSEFSLRNLSKKAVKSIAEVDILPENYYRDIAPIGPNGEPVHVKVSVVILSMKVTSGSDQVSEIEQSTAAPLHRLILKHTLSIST